MVLIKDSDITCEAEVMGTAPDGDLNRAYLIPHAAIHARQYGSDKRSEFIIDIDEIVTIM